MSAAAILLGVAGAAGGGAGAFSVTASPPSFSAGGIVQANRVFGPCTVVPTGGSGSYTVAWSVVVTNTSAGFSASTSLSTNIELQWLFGDTATATVRCTVTDDVSGLIAHVDVPVAYTHFDTLGGV